MKKAKIIAHRGASAEAPENTLSAIRKALEIGVDCIEFDVRLTKDHVPVVIHDPTVQRTTGKGNASYVHDLTLAQIKELDAGSWRGQQFANEKIPTLNEVLQLVSGQTALMIEIKKGVQLPGIIVENISKVIKSAEFDPELLKIGSFSIEIVQELKKHYSLSNLIGIIEETDKIKAFLDHEIKHLALWYKLFTPELIDKMHHDNICLWTFTVDDPEVAQLLMSLSIAGIITNNPSDIQKNCK